MQDSWRRKVAESSIREARPAAFEDLVEFIRSEAEMLSDPVYCRESIERTDRLLEGKLHKPDETKAKVKIHAVTIQEEQREPVSCTFCEKESLPRQVRRAEGET